MKPAPALDPAIVTIIAARRDIDLSPGGEAG